MFGFCVSVQLSSNKGPSLTALLDRCIIIIILTLRVLMRGGCICTIESPCYTYTRVIQHQLVTLRVPSRRLCSASRAGGLHWTSQRFSLGAS